MSKLSLQPEYDLGGRNILVTGAGDGIGKAVAMQCGKAGATVILLGKTVKKLEIIYDELVAAGAPEPAIYPMNFEGAGADDYEALRWTLADNFDHIDALFNNAGWLGASSPIEQFDLELWYKIMQVNLNAPFMLTKACIPLLKKSGHAAVVFNTDEKDTAYWGAYGIAKAGTNALANILADELESSNVQVNAFNPEAVRGSFRTRAFPGEDGSILPTADYVAKYYVALLSGEITSQMRTLKAGDFGQV
jgi:NAD(P)-dependent dehydrogenase (short-subunit alcohol dehydrogenase family)